MNNVENRSNVLIIDTEEGLENKTAEELAAIAPKTVEAAYNLIEKIVGLNNKEIELSRNPKELMKQLLGAETMLQTLRYNLNKVETALNVIWGSKIQGRISLNAGLSNKIDKLLGFSLELAHLKLNDTLHDTSSKIKDVEERFPEEAEAARDESEQRIFVEELFNRDSAPRATEIEEEGKLSKVIFDLVKNLPTEIAIATIITIFFALLFIIGNNTDISAEEDELRDTLALVQDEEVTAESISKLMDTIDKLAKLVEKDIGSVDNLHKAILAIDIDALKTLQVEYEEGMDDEPIPDVEVISRRSGYQIVITQGEDIQRLLISNEVISEALSAPIEDVTISYIDGTLIFAVDGETIASLSNENLISLIGEDQLLTLSGEEGIEILTASFEGGVEQVETVQIVTPISNSTNIRVVAAIQSGVNPIATVSADTELTIIQTVEDGEPIQGNPVWHQVTWLNEDGEEMTGWVADQVVSDPESREIVAEAAPTPPPTTNGQEIDETPTPDETEAAPDSIRYGGQNFDVTETPNNASLIAVTPENAPQSYFDSLIDQGYSILDVQNKYYLLLPNGTASQFYFEDNDQRTVVVYDEDGEIFLSRNVEQSNTEELPEGAFMLDLDGNPIFYGRNENLPALPQQILDSMASVRVNDQFFPYETFAGIVEGSLNRESLLVWVPDSQTGENGLVLPFYTDQQIIYTIDGAGNLIPNDYETIQDIPAGSSVIVQFFINDGSGNVHPSANATITPQDMIDFPNTEGDPDVVDNRAMRYWAVPSIIITVIEPSQSIVTANNN